MKKPKISVEVSTAEYDRIKEYARREGVSVSQWVRKVLSAASPKVQTGSTQAHQALDEMERVPLRPIVAPRRIEPLPPPPEPKPVTEVKGLPPGHPCTFFTPTACRNAVMGGRACRWPAPVAAHCDAFAARKF